MMLVQICIVLFNLITFLNSQEEELRVMIGMPEYICEKGGDIRDVSKDMTAIRLLGQDAQKLDYKFEVNFQKLGNRCRNNQRCTLLTWRAARQLDKFLKDYPPDKMRTGLIEINNTMFMPGVKYILNVTIINDGKILQEKRLTLDYLDEDDKKAITKPMASLLLLAADTSYAHIPYIINAEATICSNISSYRFKWEIFDNSRNITTRVGGKGAELEIPKDTFHALTNYALKCDLVNLNENTTVAESVHEVNILSKGLQVNIPIKHLTTTVNQPVILRSTVRDLDNADNEYQISWVCEEVSSGEECDYHSEINEAELDSSFPKTGTFKITLVVTRDEFIESDFCEVEVRENVPTIEFDAVDVPMAVSEAIRVPVQVFGLNAGCGLQWSAPGASEHGYEEIDLSNMPGNCTDLVNITMKNDVFLGEIEEFDSSTIDKKHDLTIPKPLPEIWPGLKGDSKYLFRLTIKCPVLNETLGASNMSTITNDFAIETNSPPAVSPLFINPPRGEAFSTKFSFRTQKAVDKDGPILYKFGLILGNRNLVLATFGDVTNAEIILPYSKDGVETFLEVCDIFSACTRISGPVVQTDFPEQITAAFYQNILRNFQGMLVQEDYYKAFTHAAGILNSFEAVGNAEKLNESRNLIGAKIEAEIDRFLGFKITDREWEKSVNSFTEILLDFNKENSTDLKILDRIINKLQTLQNLITRDKQRYSKRRLLSTSSSEDYISLQTVKNSLQLHEASIKALNDADKISEEKENLRMKLLKYMQKLCVVLHNRKSQPVQLEFKSLIFAVEKFNLRNLMNSGVFEIPFQGNSWGIDSKVKIVLDESHELINKKCVGKAVLKNYLDREGFVFLAEILDGSEDEHVENILKLDNVGILLPIDTTRTGQPQCMVYNNNNNEWNECQTVKSGTNSHVKCSCKNLGYFHLEYNDVMTEELASREETATVQFEEVFNNTSSDNATLTESLTKNKDYEAASYVVIAVSIIGILIVGLVLRRVINEEDDDEDVNNDTYDFPKYAKLHDEEYLQDAHM